MEAWNDLAGDWQGLTSPAQARRYESIAEVIQSYCPAESILDVGCGEALLRDYLPGSVRYTGIEPSALAVQSARAKSERGHIIHVRCEDWEPRGREWDCIVFNEVLYYLEDPVGLLAKYAQSVSHEGIVVISILQKGDRPSMKSHLLHLLDRRRPLSNVHCTNLVCGFMSQHSWALERDSLIPTADGNRHWRLIVARPARG